MRPPCRSSPLWLGIQGSRPSPSSDEVSSALNFMAAESGKEGAVCSDAIWLRTRSGTHLSHWWEVVTCPNLIEGRLGNTGILQAQCVGCFSVAETEEHDKKKRAGKVWEGKADPSRNSMVTFYSHSKTETENRKRVKLFKAHPQSYTSSSKALLLKIPQPFKTVPQPLGQVFKCMSLRGIFENTKRTIKWHLVNM